MVCTSKLNCAPGRRLLGLFEHGHVCVHTTHQIPTGHTHPRSCVHQANHFLDIRNLDRASCLSDYLCMRVAPMPALADVPNTRCAHFT